MTSGATIMSAPALLNSPIALKSLTLVATFIVGFKSKKKRDAFEFPDGTTVEITDIASKEAGLETGGDTIDAKITCPTEKDKEN